MTRSTELFGKRTTNPKLDKINRDSRPAFSGTLKGDTISVLTTNTLSNTYYASSKEMIGETLDVLKSMAEEDATFLGKALVYSRNIGLMRIAPIVGLVVLSAQEGEEAKDAFRAVFPKVIRTPDDLREFVSICRSGQIRKGLGGVARDAVKSWLRTLSEYHAVKYGSNNSKDITLRDVLRMAHPNPTDKTQATMFKYLVHGADDLKKKDVKDLKMILALENLKKAASSNDEDQIVSIIETSKLPWEVVVPSVPKMTTKTWTALMHNMPYMALLRNLATLERHGVFNTKKNVEYVANFLKDPKRVKGSKQFPFRFFNAHETYSGHQKITDAIVDALEVSSDNLPEFDGDICIANDVSGSMTSCATEKGNINLMQIASLMGAALFKKSGGDVLCLPFDNVLYVPKLSSRDSIMTNSKKLMGNGGGTSLCLPVEQLTKVKAKVDVLVLITDMEDNTGQGFRSAWRTYRRTVNPKAKAFFCNIAPYRDYPTHTAEPGVFYVHGWSDSVLRYIATTAKGTDKQIEEVEAIDLFTKETSEGEDD